MEIEEFKSNSDGHSYMSGLDVVDILDMKLREDVNTINPVLNNTELMTDYLGTRPDTPERFSSAEQSTMSVKL